jgi:U3 small nucleolar RNA-associated protein 11
LGFGDWEQPITVVSSLVFSYQPRVEVSFCYSIHFTKMSSIASFRKALPRKEHKERGQPSHRRKLGILEKHKDYVLRARDYHRKQQRLKALKEKAEQRNPDEFYHRMIYSRIRRGRHMELPRKTIPDKTLKILRIQDLSYINYKIGLEKSKILRLRDSLGILEHHDIDTPHPIQQQQQREEGGIRTANRNSDSHSTKSPSITSINRNQHILFVDNEKEARQFDPIQHFCTFKEYLDKPNFRPRLDLLKKQQRLTTITTTSSLRNIIKSTRDHLSRNRLKRNCRYLVARVDRLKKLENLAKQLTLQRNLMIKGKRRKIGKNPQGIPIYRWANERKS